MVVFLHRKRFTFARRPLRSREMMTLSLDSWVTLDATLLSSIFGMARGGGLGYADVVATR